MVKVISHYGHKDKDAVESDIVPTLKAESHGHEPMIKIKVSQINTENKESNGGVQPFQQNRIYDADGLSPALNKDKADLIIKVNTKKGEEVFWEGDSLNYSNSNSNSKTRRGRVGKGTAQTLDTAANQAVIVASRGRNKENPSDRTPGNKVEQRLEPNTSNTSNTLTGVEKDNYVLKNQQIRRLTEIECERLQTFPDNWTQYGMYPARKNAKGKTIKVSQKQFEAMSNEEKIQHFSETLKKKIPRGQRYKLCGNAVTTEIPQIIAKKLLESLSQPSGENTYLKK